jgi:hypothetical protein
MNALGESDQVLGTLSQLERGGAFQHSARMYKSYLIGEPVEGLNKNDLTRLKLWQVRGDKSKFQALLADNSLSATDSTVLKNLQINLENSPGKNPWIAGIGSMLLPGLGQAYVGAWQSAGIALLFNALFLSTTVEFANRDLKFAAAASGLVFSVTYIGNIINAVSAANQYGKNASAPSEQALKKKLFPEFEF